MLLWKKPKKGQREEFIEGFIKVTTIIKEVK